MTPTGSTAFALENAALRAEIKRMTEQMLVLQMLCLRAADALEMWQTGWKYSDMTTDLIAELREAGK